MSAPAHLIELRNVTKRYGDVSVLDAVALNIARGESLAIVGPSGSGKSTLLQIIGTLDRATGGEVLLDGKNLGALDDVELASVRSQQIGFVFQSHYLLPQCTVLENVLVPTLAGGNQRGGIHLKSEIQNLKPGIGEGLFTSEAKETSESRALRLLKRVGLGERLHHRPGQLSGGERQRAAVVRALINSPQLLLADEPTGALDHASATALGQLLVELNKEEGVTLIVVTHAMDLAKRMGRVARIESGKFVEDGR
jgi:lipoprotein-releasing system ATP-binding protein